MGAIRELMQFGLRGTKVRVGIESGYDGLQPIGWDLHIVVEQHDKVTARMGYGRVVAACKAPVVRMPNNPDLRVGFPYPLRAAIGGCVIGKDDFESVEIGGHDARKTPLEQIKRVPGHNDDGNADGSHRCRLKLWRWWGSGRI